VQRVINISAVLVPHYVDWLLSKENLSCVDLQLNEALIRLSAYHISAYV
jgi:hypothetical protein